MTAAKSSSRPLIRMPAPSSFVPGKQYASWNGTDGHPGTTISGLSPSQEYRKAFTPTLVPDVLLLSFGKTHGRRLGSSVNGSRPGSVHVDIRGLTPDVQAQLISCAHQL